MKNKVARPKIICQEWWDIEKNAESQEKGWEQHAVIDWWYLIVALCFLINMSPNKFPPMQDACKWLRQKFLIPFPYHMCYALQWVGDGLCLRAQTPDLFWAKQAHSRVKDIKGQFSSFGLQQTICP